MNLKEYCTLAVRTASKQESIKEHAVHAAMGAVTEVGELFDNFKRHRFYKKDLDVVNFKEEIGDVMWYVALAFHTVGIECPVVAPELDPQFKNEDYILAQLQRSASSFSFISLINFEEWNEDNVAHYGMSTLKYLRALAELYSFSLEEAADINIEKLRKRYPDNFTLEHAINRDVANELSHIST